MTTLRAQKALAATLALAALLAIATAVTRPAAASPDIEQKRTEARALYDRILETASAAEHAQEAVNLANIRLDETQVDLASNRRHLDVAKKSLAIAHDRVAERLRALYLDGESGGAVEVLLGAESIDDLLTRIDLVQRVGELDSNVIGDVRQFRRDVVDRRARLRAAEVKQAEILADKKSREREIQSSLAELERLYAENVEEIRRLEEEERRRAAAAAERALRAREEAARRAAAATAAASSESVTPLSAPADFATPIPTAPLPEARYGGVVDVAMRYLGVPYVFGGMSPAGFDCSGLISYAYAALGVTLPHHAASQYNHGTPVARNELQAGDLVFFDGLGHAGIYIAGGNFIHSPHTGDVVKISSLYQSWYDSRWVGGRRIS